MTTKLLIDRELLERAERNLASGDEAYRTQQERRAQLAAPVQGEAMPVSAQVRFRRPEKGMPDWSVWQQTTIKPEQPAWSIDSVGYEVEYRLLYTTPPQPAEVGELVEEIVPKWRYDALVQHCKLQDKNIAKLSDERNTAWMYEQREVWFWQGDGEDYPESLSCPVVIKADDLRAILAKLGE